MIDPALRDAAIEAVKRMRVMWPAHRWGEPDDPDSAAREYGQALIEIGDAGAIASGVTAAIREVGGRFPPALADLLIYVRSEVPKPERTIPATSPNHCPVCKAEGARGLGRKVVVDPESGIASCTEGTHRYAWRAA